MSDASQETKQTMLEHLVELRRRLQWCVAALVVAFGICVYFAGEIFDFLASPLRDAMIEKGMDPEKVRLVYTQLYEKFFADIKIGFYAGAFLAFPFFALQIWKFVAPGLYKHEQKAFLPFLLATPILFFAGGALVYYFIFPLAWSFFLDFQQSGTSGQVAIDVLPRVADYLSLVIRLIFAFGISFQLPVALTLMARVGLVSSQGLAKKRKYAVVIVFVAAAILTLPDVISQVGLAIPILLLYEVSIILARMTEKKRAQREAELEAELGGE